MATGSALGGILRVLVGGWFTDWVARDLPWGILSVNLIGSASIGLLAGSVGPGGGWMVSPGIRLFLIAGLCGGFTTFSLFSLQTLELILAGRGVAAGFYSLATLGGGVVVAWGGFTLARRVSRADRAGKKCHLTPGNKS